MKVGKHEGAAVQRLAALYGLKCSAQGSGKKATLMVREAVLTVLCTCSTCCACAAVGDAIRPHMQRPGLRQEGFYHGEASRLEMLWQQSPAYVGCSHVEAEQQVNHVTLFAPVAVLPCAD